MGSGIFTRKARELIFHNKIQQSSIDFTRFNIIKRSNRSAKEIIIIGIGKVTQFGYLAPSWQAIQHTSTQEANERERRTGQRGRIKRQGWSWGKENERQMANNVMRGRWVCDGYLLRLDLSEYLPGNGARNPSCYLLSTALVFPWRGKGDAAK